MNKLLPLIIVLAMCLSLCACGGKITEEAVLGELAEAKYWEYSIDSALGTASDNFTFRDSGTVVYTFFLDDNLISGYMGTAVVRLEDNTIDMIFTGEVDSNLNITSLDQMKFDTLSYSFEGGRFKLFNGEGYEFEKVAD